MHQVTGGVQDRELALPRLTVAEALLSAPEQEALSRVADMARSGLAAMGSGDGGPWVSLPRRGLKVLIHGSSYGAGLQAAEALAGVAGLSLLVLFAHRSHIMSWLKSAPRAENTPAVKPGD
jgi:hypothetical protein